jgi:hypothetical protein
MRAAARACYKNTTNVPPLGFVCARSARYTAVPPCLAVHTMCCCISASSSAGSAAVRAREARPACRRALAPTRCSCTCARIIWQRAGREWSVRCAARARCCSVVRCGSANFPLRRVHRRIAAKIELRQRPARPHSARSWPGLSSPKREGLAHCAARRDSLARRLPRPSRARRLARLALPW